MLFVRRRPGKGVVEHLHPARVVGSLCGHRPVAAEHHTVKAEAIEHVLEILSKNVELAKKTIHNVIEAAPATRSCSCASALQNAIITERKKIPGKVRAALRPIVGKYL